MNAWAVLLVMLLLGGCASPSSETTTTSETKQYDDGGANKLDVPLLPAEPPAPGERSLAKVPEWKLGEYWTYDVTDLFTGNTFTATRVVAGTDGDNYLVGFPIDAFSNDLLIFHIPGVGDVARGDLSFEVHDVLYEPFKFPMQVGNIWPTQFEGRAVNVTVEEVSGSKAVLTAQGPGTNITYTYDAEAAEVTELLYPGYMQFTVREHGFGYVGQVRVPHAHDLIFLHGRFAGISDASNGQFTTATTETVEVSSGYDRASFILAAGTPLGLPVDSTLGVFRETATAPDGTVYELQVTPADPALRITFHGVEQPGGTWNLQHVAAGPGIAFIEGIGYHSIDIELPSGCVVESFNAQHHQAPCRTS